MGAGCSCCTRETPGKANAAPVPLYAAPDFWVPAIQFVFQTVALGFVSMEVVGSRYASTKDWMWIAVSATCLYAVTALFTILYCTLWTPTKRGGALHYKLSHWTEFVVFQLLLFVVNLIWMAFLIGIRIHYTQETLDLFDDTKSVIQPSNIVVSFQVVMGVYAAWYIAIFLGWFATFARLFTPKLASTTDGSGAYGRVALAAPDA